MSDRIAVMDQGRVLQVGTPAQIYSAPACREVMEFIGSVNIFNGRVVNAQGEVDLDGLARVRAQGSETFTPGTEVSVLVRPERIRICAEASAATVPPLRGIVSKVAPLGFVTHVSVRLAHGGEVLAYRLNGGLNDGSNGAIGAGEAPPAEQQPVFVWWDAADAHAYPAHAHIATHGVQSGPLHPQGD